MEKVPSTVAKVCSKLKRLKIQESLLLKNISTNSPQDCFGDYENHTFIPNTNESKYENFFTEMWISLRDLKARTESENLDDADILELKNDVLALDTQIKNLKANLQVELINAMETEKQILNKMCEDPEPDNLERKVRVQSFDNIVPSPVKIYRDTPMKHDAVTDFDDFIRKHKKYDGWFEYNHNIFAQLWEKYFGTNIDASKIEVIFKSNRFAKFSMELLNKVQGVMLSNDDIIEHGRWYTQFCTLKSQKKLAIANWQAKRNIFRRNFTNDFAETRKKKTSQSNQEFKIYSNSVMTSYASSLNSPNESIDLSDSRSVTPIPRNTFSSDSLQRIQRPTKQWLSKCTDDVDDNSSHSSSCEVDNIQKVKEPLWRAALKSIE